MNKEAKENSIFRKGIENKTRNSMFDETYKNFSLPSLSVMEIVAEEALGLTCTLFLVCEYYFYNSLHQGRHKHSIAHLVLH